MCVSTAVEPQFAMYTFPTSSELLPANLQQGGDWTSESSNEDVMMLLDCTEIAVLEDRVQGLEVLFSHRSIIL